MNKCIVKAGLFFVLSYVGAIMVKKAIVSDTQEIDVVARTIWGEARGEGITGMQAVANVICNRVSAAIWYGASFEDVCKKPYQFSCWNASDPNSSKCAFVTDQDETFKSAKYIAELALNGLLADITRGANHYHATGVRPNWADDSKRTATIGNHIFYKL